MSDMAVPAECRDVIGFPGYRVDGDGTVWTRKGRSWRAADQATAWKRLRPFPHPKTGHLTVSLRREGRTFQRKVHHLVLEAFVGPRPEGTVGCHRDGDPQNNRAGNLRWGTPQSNSDDMVRHGRSTRGERHPMAKLTPEAVMAIRLLLAEGRLPSAIAPRFRVSVAQVQRIGNRTTWGHLPQPGRDGRDFTREEIRFRVQAWSRFRSEPEAG